MIPAWADSPLVMIVTKDPNPLRLRQVTGVISARHHTVRYPRKISLDKAKDHLYITWAEVVESSKKC